jgi:hypothetical protein
VGLFNFLMRLAFERFWLFLLLTIIGVPVLLERVHFSLKHSRRF